MSEDIREEGAHMAASSPARGKPKPMQGWVRDDIVRQCCIGLAVAFLLFGGLGGWAATSELAGAVLASGTVVVDSNVKKVQHPTGGVVGEIRVHDGDLVSAGDLVMRLDETVTRANLAIVADQLDQFAVRLSRLRAERDDREWEWPAVSFAERRNEPELQVMFADERHLYDSRKASRSGQKQQLTERIAQLGEETKGLDAQRLAKAKESELIGVELGEIGKLWEQHLVPLSKKSAMEREAARLEGEQAQLTASIAQAKGKISEIQLQILGVDQDMRTEVNKEMRELQAKIAEYSERRVAAEDQLKRIDIRAPQSGMVHQLSVHTIGGVINPGEPIMLIVPGGDELVVEAKIAPQDIDHVHVGQGAFLRFPAFNQRTTPEFMGEVTRISADLTRDPQSNQGYFVVRVKILDADDKRLGQLKLVPGMPAEVHIRTPDRTALSYLTKPLRDQIAKTFVEQ
jgi:HlyD family secretion protein